MKRKNGRREGMPDRKTHNAIAKLFTNLSDKDIDWINKTIDSKIMLTMHGPNHRKYWGHDISSLVLMMGMSKIKDKGELAKAWYIHTQLDKMSRKDQKKLKILMNLLNR